jgi:hypothetical protein
VTVIFLLALAACSEYSINPEVDKSLGADPDDTPLDDGDIGDDDSGDDEETDDDGDPNEETEEPPPADAPVYAHDATTLYEVEPTTGQRTYIGDFTLDGLSHEDSFIDIAIDLDGRMFGATFFALYQINPTDASIREVCEVDLDMVALTFSSDGELFAGGSDGVNIINVNNCRTTPLAVGSYQTSGDLVGLPDGYLYWTVLGSSRDELVRVDPLDGRTERIGSVGFSTVYGLGYDDGVLFGFNSYGETLAISPDNASAEILVTDRSISWYGATTNPVQW